MLRRKKKKEPIKETEEDIGEIIEEDEDEEDEDDSSEQEALNKEIEALQKKIEKLKNSPEPVAELTEKQLPSNITPEQIEQSFQLLFSEIQKIKYHLRLDAY